MFGQPIRAPQYGVWSPMAPAIDPQAAGVPGLSPALRARLAELREAARALAVARVRSAPDVWRL